MKKDVKRFMAGVCAFVCLLAVASVGGWHSGYRWNATASYPEGLWRISYGTPHKGDLVFFKPPEDNSAILWARETGILNWQWGLSTTMLKRIVAVEGDLVEVTDHVSVNGQVLPNSYVSQHDGAGRSIPALAHSGVVPPGKVWLMSDFNVKSFDSRYFGQVDASAILGFAHPVFTW